MKYIFISAILGFTTLFYSCNKKNNSEKDQKVSEETTTENIQGSPEKVVALIFEAAKTGNYDVLKSICDPKGENDGDTKRICEVVNNPKDREEFKTYFLKGSIESAPVINGEKAEVKIKFGPDGTKDETMNLVKRDGKWYLSSI